MLILIIVIQLWINFPFYKIFFPNNLEKQPKKSYNFYSWWMIFINQFDSFQYFYFFKNQPFLNYTLNKKIYIYIFTFHDFNKQKFKYPDASRSLVGFHAHMKTSDSCPRKTVALFVGISCPTSTSIASVWFAGEKK